MCFQILKQSLGIFVANSNDITQDFRSVPIRDGYGACNAADLQYSARVTASEETNPNYLPVSVNNERPSSLYGQLEFIHNGYQLDMRLLGAIKATNYNSDDISDATTAQLNTDVLWVISPSQFELYLGDVYMQTAIDSTSTITPDNQQNINASSFGPNYIIRIDKRAMLLFHLH